MKTTAICPHYGKNEDACDVGCGYITSHDARMIIKYCSSCFESCHKYQELMGKPAAVAAPPEPRVAPTGVSPQSLPLFGLLTLGLCTAIYACSQLPLPSMDLRALAILLFAGALGQIGSGLGSLKKNPLRAVAFTGFGLFWLSLIALDILPQAGYGKLPGTLPMVGYLAMWGLFSLILCQGLDALSRVCRLVFALMTAFLLLLALATATANTATLHLAAAIGLASSLPGIVLNLHHAWRETALALQPELSRDHRVR
ncbi:MAG: acetate uptake transporter [Desulfuromonadales bacterium]|nr:acetate uptake transporter [Desulfuromonadales bacterium]